MKRRSIALLAALLVAASSAAPAADCESAKKVDEKSLTESQREFLKTLQERNPPCPTFTAVVRRLVANEKRGGFRLEDGRPLDVDAARAELARAMKDPEIAGRLAAARKTEKTEPLRLAFEAGILDEEGFYAASSLKVQELQAQLR